MHKLEKKKNNNNHGNGSQYSPQIITSYSISNPAKINMVKDTPYPKLRIAPSTRMILSLKHRVRK